MSHFYFVLLFLSQSGSLNVSQPVHLHPHPGMRMWWTGWFVAEFLFLGSVQKMVSGEIIMLPDLLLNLSHHFKVEHLSSLYL